MELTITLDDATETRLITEACQNGKIFDQYVAEVLMNFPIRLPSQAGSKPNLGFAADWGIWVSGAFDEPLQEFEEYVQMIPVLPDALTLLRATREPESRLQQCRSLGRARAIAQGLD